MAKNSQFGVIFHLIFGDKLTASTPLRYYDISYYEVNDDTHAIVHMLLNDNVQGFHMAIITWPKVAILV